MALRFTHALCALALAVGGSASTEPDEHQGVVNPRRQCSKQVVPRPGFPSFTDYSGTPYEVSFDSRSLLLDGERALFLSGSIHGPRGTPALWEAALDDAVEQGLNMIQVYVFWNYHQPLEGAPTDWFGDGGAGDLAGLIEACACRGLFVNLRIGPYVCAEWNYGGLPVWLGFKEGIEFRRYNAPWMDAMGNWTAEVVAYTASAGLFAHQGGPVVLGQIENELDASDDPQGEEYVAWCGDLANDLVPEIPWLMCNGDAANNTINSCNGYGDSSCGTDWIEAHGNSGRIQIDQPALWTENEGGFQIWGDDPAHPTDYFYGLTAAELTFTTVQWFARGGAHTNYYMWWGGSNRGVGAGAGITNGYAVDAPMCANGMRHQPKFDHLAAMHAGLADAAAVLLAAPTQLGLGVELEVVADVSGSWGAPPEGTGPVLGFIYGPALAFAENQGGAAVLARLPDGTEVALGPKAAAIVRSGVVVFTSSDVSDAALSYRRADVDLTAGCGLAVEGSWAEPVGAPASDPATVVGDAPLEQSLLTRSVVTDFAWYEVDFEVGAGSSEVFEVVVGTQKSDAWLAFVDGAFMDAADDHEHQEGSVNATLRLGSLSPGTHTLSLLSESLGYHNLVGRWGVGTGPKTKGITSAVTLRRAVASVAGPAGNASSAGGAVALVDGRPWRMRADLAGKDSGRARTSPSTSTITGGASIAGGGGDRAPGMWTALSFTTPALGPGEALMLDGAALGRGRLWLNGHDLGRFWNITRSGSSAPGVPTQRHYHLPPDFCAQPSGSRNDLLLFDALGGDPAALRLLSSALVATDAPALVDAVDDPAGCLD